MKILVSLSKAKKYMSIAQKTGQLSIFRQMTDIAYLRFGKTRMSAREYYKQSLFDEKICTNRENLNEFGGIWFKEWIHAQLNDIRWEGMVTDKLIAYALFDKFGLPYPRIHAVACNFKRNYGDVPVFGEPELLAEFMRSAMPYPFFCKPVTGHHGRNTYRVQQYDDATDKLTFNDGKQQSIKDFICSLDTNGDGFNCLFQEAATVNPELREVCGDVVTGCRIIMLLDNNGAYPFKVAWKIPMENSHLDNFSGGKSGTTIADIDIHNGQVIRSISPDENGNFILNKNLGTTNGNLVGYQLPDWNNLIATAKRAAECFPGFRWQHWDFGLTSNGPLIYELNSAGDTDLMQISSGKGIYDKQLRKFIEKYGYKKEKV